MYTSAVADVCKTNYLSLKLLPLSEGQKVHHLFYVSGVAVFRGQASFSQYLNSTKNVSEEIFVSPWDRSDTAVPTNILSIAKSVIIDLGNLGAFAKSDLDLLDKFENIFVSSGKWPDAKQVDALNIFESIGSKVSFLVFETHELSPENIFQVLPSWLKQKVAFVYLPKQSPRDCLLSPVEVVERFKVRTLQCAEQSLELNIASFGAGALADLNHRSFYDLPSEVAYLKIIEKEKYFSFWLKKILRTSGLAGILGFLFWILKVVLNPSDYNICLEFLGWTHRALGWLHGLFVDSVMSVKRVYGLTVSLGVNSFWFLRRNMGRTWQIRLLLAQLWGNRWRLGVFLRRKIGEVWRIKVFFLRAWSQRWRIPAVIRSFLGQSWKIRVYSARVLGESWRIPAVIRSFLGQSWKIRVYGARVLGESWRIRDFLRRLYWKCRELVWWLLRRPIFYLLYPFKKVYWFSRYQFEKRVLGKIEKRSGNE